MAYFGHYLAPVIANSRKSPLAPFFRFRFTFSSQTHTQRSYSSVSAAEQKKMDELAKNPFYSKYANKIATIEKESPDVLKAKLEELKSQKLSSQPATTPICPTPVPNPKVSVSSYGFSKKKVLSDIMKLELIADKSAKELSEIWLNYFKDKDVISAVVPETSYRIMEQRFIDYPTFVFPLPRDTGYEFMLCQFASNECHLTSLINYQTHKENAPECLTMVYYDDLKKQGVVLMKGDYNKDILNAKEAQCLANLVQLYYAGNEGSKLELLRRFTHEAQNFDVMEIVNETNSLKL